MGAVSLRHAVDSVPKSSASVQRQPGQSGIWPLLGKVQFLKGKLPVALTALSAFVS